MSPCEASTSPLLADSSPSLTRGAGRRGCCLCRGQRRVQGHPSEEQVFFKDFSPLSSCMKGTQRVFLFFKEFNPTWFIFSSIRNSQPPPSSSSQRTPRPAGEVMPDTAMLDTRSVMTPVAPPQEHLCSPVTLCFTHPSIRCCEGLSEIPDSILHQAMGAEDQRHV